VQWPVGYPRDGTPPSYTQWQVVGTKELRVLFCLPVVTLSGGVKVIFELANRLIESGDTVEVFSFARSPQWFPLKANFVAAEEIEAIDVEKYDFVIVSNAFLVPLVLAHHPRCRCVLFCLDCESFHHSRGNTFHDFISDDLIFSEIYRLPIPLISASRGLQALLQQRVGRNTYLVQLGINKNIFFPRNRTISSDTKRVLLIGNYLMPFKGMKDGLEALRQLSVEMSVQLVLITQETRGRAIFNELPYPVEVHLCPTEAVMPEIITSCDIYCCTSWYEGLGLPALEAFCCGVPVVSTQTYGVSEYGVDEINLLLAQPNDPQDLYVKMKRLLSDSPLAGRLREAAFRTVSVGYDWDRCVAHFRRILLTIRETYIGLMSDPQLMRQLSARLEEAGNFTPVAILRQLDQLSNELADIISKIRGKVAPMPNLLCQLRKLRDGFGAYLGNEKTEYYDMFKSKFDFCRLLLGLWTDNRFNDYLDTIINRRVRCEPRSNPSFLEIRYSDAEPRNRRLA
jgi:glycosyltransferase involved in cell wall biosynthesis